LLKSTLFLIVLVYIRFRHPARSFGLFLSGWVFSRGFWTDDVECIEVWYALHVGWAAAMKDNH
jgi:hypothetical protein